MSLLEVIPGVTLVGLRVEKYPLVAADLRGARKAAQVPFRRAPVIVVEPVPVRLGGRPNQQKIFLQPARSGCFQVRLVALECGVRVRLAFEYQRAGMQRYNHPVEGLLLHRGNILSDEICRGSVPAELDEFLGHGCCGSRRNGCKVVRARVPIQSRTSGSTARHLPAGARQAEYERKRRRTRSCHRRPTATYY